MSLCEMSGKKKNNNNATWCKKSKTCETYGVTGEVDMVWIPLNCMPILFIKREKKKETSTTPSCSGPIPAQKSLGNSVRGVLFSETMPKMDHRFS